MKSHSQVAKKVRLAKEAHPEHFCSDPRCLWRTWSANSDEARPCPKHMRAVQPQHNSEGKMLHYVDADGRPLVRPGELGMTTDEASRAGMRL